MQHAHSYCFFSLLFSLAIATGCAPPSSPHTAHSPGEKKRQTIFAIKNVNVIPMTSGGEVLPNVTVIISNERIASFNGPVPAEAEFTNAALID